MNNRGYIAVTVILIMALLSIAGIFATTTATLEIQIAANEKRYKQQFYLAESAALEGVRILAKANVENLKNGDIEGFAGKIGPRFKNLWRQIEDWEPVGAESESGYAIVYRGPASGNSLEMNSMAERHNYSVLGRSGGESATVLVEIGYWRRY